MTDRLSIQYLLSLLVFKQKDVFFRYASFDPDAIKLLQTVQMTGKAGQEEKADVVRRLCERAELMRKSSRYPEAVEIATEATEIAHDAFDHNLQGIALLYRGAMQSASGNTETYQQAISDCNRAIRDFCLEPHNYSIALIIRARIQMQLYKAAGNETALSYLRQASRMLGKIITEFHGADKSKVTALYQTLRTEIDAVIENIVDSRTEIKPRPIVPQHSIRSAAPRDKLIGVFSGSVQALAHRSIPIFSVSVRAGSPIGGFPDEGASDYIAIADQIMIQGRPYFLHWANDKKHVRHTFQLREDSDYVAILVEGQSMQPALQPNEYVLVKKQSYHDFDGQLVVVSVGEQNENNPAQYIVKRARGHPAVHLLESDNLDRVKYPPIMTASSEIQIEILGIVEAILTPGR